MYTVVMYFSGTQWEENYDSEQEYPLPFDVAIDLAAQLQSEADDLDFDFGFTRLTTYTVIEL